MLADQAFDSACVDLSRFGSLTQREAALPSAAQRFAPLLFVSTTLAWAAGVSRQRPLWRDPNIAFMNELSLVFQTPNIDTRDVLAAARASADGSSIPFTRPRSNVSARERPQRLMSSTSRPLLTSNARAPRGRFCCTPRHCRATPMTLHARATTEDTAKLTGCTIERAVC
jgi:hypothetical protein